MQWPAKLAVAALAGLAAPLSAQSVTSPAAQEGAASARLPEAAAVLRLTERAADWQLAHLTDFSAIPTAGPETRSSRQWQQGAFYVGLAALAERSRAPRFRKAVIANGRANRWMLAERPFHADDQAIAASYIWAHRHGAPRQAIADFKARTDAIVAASPSGPLEFSSGPGAVACQQRWCWSDALFMAPPSWFALSQITGDPRYASYADREFRAAADHLFDPAERLFYRDSRFFTRKAPNGRKVFWSRGNGWAFAGLARLLDELPRNDPRRPYYVDLFKRMAGALIAIQKPDGYWSPSLLADPATMPPEASGTGFFVYGLAWGVRHGVLDRAATLRAIGRGWAALERAVQPDGLVGWVQQVSDRPDRVSAKDTQFYGAGAFLLAASAVHDLAR